MLRCFIIATTDRFNQVKSFDLLLLRFNIDVCSNCGTPQAEIQLINSDMLGLKEDFDKKEKNKLKHTIYMTNVHVTSTGQAGWKTYHVLV